MRAARRRRDRFGIVKRNQAAHAGAGKDGSGRVQAVDRQRWPLWTSRRAALCGFFIDKPSSVDQQPSALSAPQHKPLFQQWKNGFSTENRALLSL
jgi:hypothetical protein